MVRVSEIYICKMTQRLNKPISAKEVYFQLALHMLVLVFYSFDKRYPHFEFHSIAFFLNYTLGTLFISYYLLPKFLYPKKHLAFLFSTLVVIILLILSEEFFLEKIFFPDTRGRYFPGVFFSLLDVLPVIAILSGFKFAWDAMGKQKELDQLQLNMQESELKFLKSQINPHFLFNNLNNLYSYAIESSPKTPTIILELSSVLRYMLYECKEKYVPLSKELKQLESFTRLNELQIEERGTVVYKAPTINSNFKIAPLILSVFIENAFKHSQNGQSENILIEITIDVSGDGKLKFNCKNNYSPQAETIDTSHGIGLENVRKRLGLLYPETHQLDIRKSENMYEVSLSLQLSKLH